MINVNLTDKELQALVQLMDAGVKAAGLQAVKNAAALMMKLEAAIKAHNEARAEDNVINFDEAENG